MPNLNEYYHLLQTEPTPFDDDTMRGLLRDALERADAETPAVTSPTAETVSHTRLNGTSIVVTTAAIIALTFWGYTSFKTQSPSAPQAPQENERVSNTTTAEQHTVPDSDEERSSEQADNGSHQALAPVLHIPSVSVTNSEEQPLLPSIADNTDKRDTTEQNVLDNKTTPPPQEEKQYWQRGRMLYQQQYSLLDQLTQIALSQVGVKTNLTQLLAPCTLSSALTGKSTSDCVLSFLESQAAQIQDTLVQSFAALALKNKNFTMPSQARPVNAELPRYQTETIVRPNPQAIDDIVPKGVNNSNVSIISNYSPMNTITTVTVLEKPEHPENQTTSPRRAESAAAMVYRQYLLAIQNHIWNTIDKLERPKDSLAQSKPVTPNNTLAKEFQQQNLPMWFQEALQQHRYSYARSIVDSILIQESNAAELYLLRGDINKAMDSVEASITDYSRTLSLQESGEIYLRRGTQYFTANKREEAYQDFDHAVRLDPKDAQAVFMRGAAAYNLKRFEEACDDWYLAAQMGHPLADSILEVKCANMLPKYARTAQREQAEKMKTLALLLERVKQGIDNMQTSYIRSEQAHRFDSLSYKSLSSRCNISAVLMGSASMHCAIHTLYTFALDLHDIPLALLVKSLGQQPSNYLSPLSSQPSSNGYDVRTNPFEPYFKMVAQQAQPKSSTNQVINEPVIQVIQPSSSSRLLDQIKRTPEQLSLQRKMQISMQQIEEYCGETYSELGITKNSTNTPRDSSEERSLKQPDNSSHQAFVPILQATAVPMQNSKEQLLAPSTTDSSGKINSAEQNISENKTMPPQQEEKQYWQRGRMLYQQQYSLLDQLTQIALSQVGVKTNLTQLLAPCTLSAALTGKSTSDCVLSFLESQAAQIQDTLVQSFAALALKNKNFTTSNSQPRPTSSQFNNSYPTGLSDATKRVQLLSKNSPVINVVQSAITPLKVDNRISSPPRYADGSAAMGYRQYLLAIQNHIWNTIDKLERPKDSLAQSKPVTPNNTLAKEFQQQNLPMWFQEALQQHRYSYARSIVDSILIQESNAAELYLLRGDINKAMDSVEASITDYSRTLSLQESGEIYLRRGNQYFTANKREEAYQDFDHAVRLEPKDAQAVFMRGAAAYNLKRFENACDDWYLAAQMGHPLADSVMAAKCAGYVPKYTRTAMAEAKQRITNTVLLIKTLQDKIQSAHAPFPKEPMPSIDSLSYRTFGSFCNANNVTDKSISTFCMVHLLYSFALELRDPIVIDFAQKIFKQISVAAVAVDKTSNRQNMNNRIDRTNYNETITKEVANGASADKIRSLQSKQAMQSAIRATQEAQQMNSPSNISPLQNQDILQLLERTKKYLHTQYAEFLDSK